MEITRTQELENGAYYTGRNSVWNGERNPTCQFLEENLVNAWRRGRRHALAEERLDADTEWDTDEGC